MKKRPVLLLLCFVLLLSASVQGSLLFVLLPGLSVLSAALLAIVFGACSVALVGLALFFWSKPGRLVSRLVTKLHDGDTIDLSVEFPDGSLGSRQWLEKALNGFTCALNSIFLDIVSATRKFNLFSSDIYFSSRQLSDQSKHQAEAMELILQKAAGFRKSLGGLSKDLTGLLEELDTSLRLYEELADTNAGAKSQLQPLVADMDDARAQALSGRQKMDSSLASLDELTGLIAELHNKIDHMNSQTQQIGRVLSGLQDIADRTHVLATNASIEAARVGKVGQGFRVIAGEVRTLASNSREAIAEVEAFLRASSEDTRTGARLSGACASKAAELKQLSDNSAHAFRLIDNGIGRISTRMSEYTEGFKRQDSVLDAVLKANAAFNQAINGFNGEIQAQISGYTSIHGEVETAARGAAAADHAAQVLAQLATYLKLGGQELNHTVAACKSSEARFMRQLQRKEKRRVMLYNLEVFEGPQLLGHLGDISPSGLLLYCEQTLPVGQLRTVAIRLPLSYGDQPDIILAIIPRRTEKEASYYRIGCSLETKDTATLSHIDMIITNYTVDKGLDIGSAVQSDSGGRAGSEPAEELEALDDLEEL